MAKPKAKEVSSFEIWIIYLLLVANFALHGYAMYSNHKVHEAIGEIIAVLFENDMAIAQDMKALDRKIGKDL